MRAALIGVAVGAVIALGVGAFFVFRGDDGPTPTTFASQLSELCVSARTQIEALGQPSEIPISKLYPGTVRNRPCLRRAGEALQPPPEQAAAAKTFLAQRGLYYDGLAYAYQFLTDQNNRSPSFRIVNGAIANLDNAETAAKEIGAPGVRVAARSSSAEGGIKFGAGRLLIDYRCMPIESPTKG